MKLNPFENSRSFYSRSKGTTKTVRDTYTKQTNPKIEEVKKVNKLQNLYLQNNLKNDLI